MKPGRPVLLTTSQLAAIGKTDCGSVCFSI